MSKLKARACPFCGCDILEFELVGQVYHYRAGIVHPAAVAGEWLCPMSGQKVALEGWNTRSDKSIN